MFQTKLILSSWLACASLTSTEAFVVRSPSSLSVMTSFARPATSAFMSEDNHGEPVNTDNQVEEGSVADAAEEQFDEQQQEEEEEEQVQQEEDPEMVALKKEIAKIETELKEKRRQIEYTADQADEYSQAGYARKVAEMENMRRARSVSLLDSFIWFLCVCIRQTALARSLTHIVLVSKYRC